MLKAKSIAVTISGVSSLVFLILFAGCSNSSAAVNNGSQGGSEGDYYRPILTGTFDVKSITISPEKIFIGETATISVTLYNNGGCEDTQNIRLYLNGVLEGQKQVHLDDGQISTISFAVVKTKYDRYWIGIEDLGVEELDAYLYVWPSGTITGDHGNGPFCSECH